MQAHAPIQMIQIPHSPWRAEAGKLARGAGADKGTMGCVVGRSVGGDRHIDKPRLGMYNGAQFLPEDEQNAGATDWR